jgi:hypothetical protein
MCSSRRLVPPSDLFAEPHTHPTDLASEPPGEVERSGRIACGDLAAGIALQLVAPPTRRTPEIGRNQCGMRSGLVTASQTSSIPVS